MPGRCFVAIDLPEAVLASLGAAERAFLEHASDWAGEKWVRQDLLHVTLKFVGLLPDPCVPDLLAALGDACAGSAPFDLALSGVRAKPAPGRASMLWATFRGDLEACADLQAEIDRLLSRRVAVEPDRRPYAPHATLVRARVARRTPAEALAAADASLSAAGKRPEGSVSVRSVTVYASTLGRGGPTYERIGDVPLGAA